MLAQEYSIDMLCNLMRGGHNIRFVPPGGIWKQVTHSAPPIIMEHNIRYVPCQASKSACFWPSIY
jgi:hypothetical protein